MTSIRPDLRRRVPPEPLGREARAAVRVYRAATTRANHVPAELCHRPLTPRTELEQVPQARAYVPPRRFRRRRVPPSPPGGAARAAVRVESPRSGSGPPPASDTPSKGTATGPGARPRAPTRGTAAPSPSPDPQKGPGTTAWRISARAARCHPFHPFHPGHPPLTTRRYPCHPRRSRAAMSSYPSPRRTCRPSSPSSRRSRRTRGGPASGGHARSETSSRQTKCLGEAGGEVRCRAEAVRRGCAREAGRWCGHGRPPFDHRAHHGRQHSDTARGSDHERGARGIDSRQRRKGAALVRNDVAGGRKGVASACVQRSSSLTRRLSASRKPPWRSIIL